MPDPAPWSSVESAGIDPQAVLSLLRRLEADGLEVHGLNLWCRGRPVLEAHWFPYRPGLLHQLNSVSKSFVSVAVGLCVAGGQLRLDDSILSFFPEYREEAAPEVSELTVRHLLTMSSGHAEPVRYRLKFSDRQPWVQTYLQSPLSHPPGSHFLYDSADTFMLSAIVQHVTGQRVLDFLRPRLLEPLGIQEASWLTSPDGIDAGGWGMSLTTADLARFGELLRCGGVWQGRQLLPRDWIEQATRLQFPTVHADPDWACGYGFQFWPCRHGAYRADGMYGQFVVVFPEQEAVLAITAGTHRMQAVLNAVWEELLPGIQAEELPPNAQVADELRETLSELRLPLPFTPQQPVSESPRSYEFPSPIHFVADDQVWSARTPGWTHVTLSCGKESQLTLSGPQGHRVLSAHWDRWTVQHTDLFEDEEEVEVATHAAIRPDGTFQFTLRLLSQLRECRFVVPAGETLQLYLPSPLEQPGEPLSARAVPTSQGVS